MPNEEITELMASLREKLDKMTSIAARLVVLSKFHEAVLPYVPSHAVNALLTDFEWALEEARPVVPATEWPNHARYCESFENEAGALREVLKQRSDDAIVSVRKA